jgi:ubiquitin C-terminal hydrolase
MGNTCYLNSTLSVLLNCPKFVSFIQSITPNDKETPRIKSAYALLESF